MSRVILILILLAVTLGTALAGSPEATRYADKAGLYTAAGKFDLALDYYTRAVALDPGNPQLYTYRAFLLLKMKRYDDALKDFSERIRLEPENPSGYLSRGLVYADLHRDKEAEEDFGAACRLGSSDGCIFASQ